MHSNIYVLREIKGNNKPMDFYGKSNINFDVVEDFADYIQDIPKECLEKEIKWLADNQKDFLTIEDKVITLSAKSAKDKLKHVFDRLNDAIEDNQDLWELQYILNHKYGFRFLLVNDEGEIIDNLTLNELYYMCSCREGVNKFEIVGVVDYHY